MACHPVVSPQDKVLEIKRLTTAIAALRSEMNKVGWEWKGDRTRGLLN
jgi:hypothetical protein